MRQYTPAYTFPLKVWVNKFLATDSNSIHLLHIGGYTTRACSGLCEATVHDYGKSVCFCGAYLWQWVKCSLHQLYLYLAVHWVCMILCMHDRKDVSALKGVLLRLCVKRFESRWHWRKALYKCDFYKPIWHLQLTSFVPSLALTNRTFQSGGRVSLLMAKPWFCEVMKACPFSMFSTGWLCPLTIMDNT